MESKNTIYILLAVIVLIYFYYHNKMVAAITPATVTRVISSPPIMLPIPSPPMLVVAPPLPIVQPLIQSNISVHAPAPAAPLPMIAMPQIIKPAIPTITPEQAVDMAIARAPKYNRNGILNESYLPANIKGLTNYQGDVEYVKAMQIIDYPAQPTNAFNSGASDLKLTGTVGSLTLTSLNAVGTVASLVGTSVAKSIAGSIPIIGSVVSVITGMFSIISAHHAAAVQNEQGLEAILIPAANNYLSIIRNAAISGQASLSDCSAALDSLLADFYSAAKNGKSGQLQNNGSTCNAMCDYWVELSAIVFYWKSKFNANQVN